ncbi:hypothetical protein F8154_07505 [Alkaliphilus pronyensis]|uniref:HlyD family efflux transporter periplasmic adaptor subunit n=1 Tax=Alkaliphilus pronyensis TaxID=1482732 RepID=A0A6I0EZ93_9FIRM|nr:HlyD family efflux transporter periplasmic adaptor subunit [Alkaliphilus pronyensis]KAB3535278.1 hypothetical protein F8154_07505 [Alkaliphilus pronyensis]
MLKKKRKTNRYLLKLIIAAVIFLYFLSRFYPIIGSSSQQTVIVEYGKIEEAVSVKGYIAREEKIHTSLGEGEIRYFVTEGEKVAMGQKLAEVYLQGLDEKTIEELDIINLRIENIKNKQGEGSIFNKDIENIDNEISKIVKQLQKEINDGEYSNVSKYESNLAELAEKKSIITGEESFSGKNLNQLLEERRLLEEKIKTNLQIINSCAAGLVAFESDGLEDIITLSSIESITTSDLDIFKDFEENTNSKEITMGTPVIRIVTNHQWSIFFPIDKKQLQTLKEGQAYRIRKSGEERLYKAVLRKIIEEDDSGIAIFNLSEAIEGYLNNRVMDIDLVSKYYEGVIIPNSAIIENDGKRGVYRIDVNGFLRFVPIKAIGQNQEFTVVHNGYFEEVNEESKTIRINTINMYDEILLNGSKGINGQRIK